MFSTPKTDTAGRISDWLLYEEDGLGRYSRENVVVALNQNLKCGAVVGVNSAGEVLEYDDETTVPGGDVAVGIIIEDVVTDGTTKKRSVIVTRHARIAPAMLVWKTGLGTTPKNNALADLLARGITTTISV